MLPSAPAIIDLDFKIIKPPPPPVLHAENITLVAHGRVILDRLDFAVAPREIVALVGPAAAGKTAALDCLAGLRPFTSGRVEVADCDLVRDPLTVAAHLAHVPADPVLPTSPTGIAHTRDHCARLGRRIPDSFLRAALAEAGLAPSFHDRPVADYPPPLRRLFAHALALLRRPSVLLLDEPAAGLDAAATAALIASFRRLRRGGLAFVIATRDLAFAQRLATRVVLLEAGSVIETLELQSSRQTHAADSYLGTLVG